MSQPTVSVIMPLYNAEKFVEQAIRSVMSQTYQDWELIVVNDCSKDKSPEIVEQLVKEDSRIRFFHTDKPSGSPTLPRNIGVEMARGRYIAFLDSDDMWLPSKLEEQLPLFDNADTMVVYSYYRKMDVEGHISDNVIKSPAKVNYNQLLTGNIIGNLTGIYDTHKTGKRYFIKVGHEDYVYWLHILKDGGYAVNTNKIHAYYRVMEGSLSSNKMSVYKWDWHIFRDVEKLSFFHACYCYVLYAIKGFAKFLR